jgi:predicted dehydrogenase
MINSFIEFDKEGNMTDQHYPSPTIALIGCGAIAEQYYLPVFSAQPMLAKNLVLVDPDLPRIEKLAKQMNARMCLQDYRDLPADVQGAILATPTHLHHPMARDLISRGMHILCEKPLADTAAHARELVELAEQKGNTIAVNYLQRLIPSFAKVKELLSQRALGELQSLEYVVGEEFDWPTISGFYFNAPLTSRGVLRDRGAHVVDHICWWLNGKPTLVCSQNDAFGGSECVSRIEFKHHNCRGTILLSWLAKTPCTFKVVCEKGVIEGEVYDYQTLSIQKGSEKKQKLKLAGDKTKLAIANKIVKNFVEILQHRAEPLISGQDVLPSLEFIDECNEQATRFEMPWYEIVENAHG